MTVNSLREVLAAELLCGGEEDREITGCYIGDLLSWVMGRAREGDVWVTIMTNMNIVAVAVMADVACILLPESCELPDDTKEKATAQGVTILRTSKSAFECAAAISRAL